VKNIDGQVRHHDEIAAYRFEIGGTPIRGDNKQGVPRQQSGQDLDRASCQHHVSGNASSLEKKPGIGAIKRPTTIRWHRQRLARDLRH